jgi:hypothetical protein
MAVRALAVRSEDIPAHERRSGVLSALREDRTVRGAPFCSAGGQIDARAAVHALDRTLGGQNSDDAGRTKQRRRWDDDAGRTTPGGGFESAPVPFRVVTETTDGGESAHDAETPPTDDQRPITGDGEPLSTVRSVPYKGADLDGERGPGLGCFRFQVIVLAVLVVLTPIGVNAGWPDWLTAALLFATIALLLVTGQTIVFLLRLVAADRRGRRRPLASGSRTVGELEDAGRPNDTDTPNDTAAPEDASTSEDAGGPEGARRLEDADAPNDTAAPEDASTSDDAAAPEGARTLEDASTDADAGDAQSGGADDPAVRQ